MSSRASTSASLEPIAKKPKAKPATKLTPNPKKPKKSAAPPVEDEDLEVLAYQPPEGATHINYNVDAGDFDWDAVKKDEDVELWLIRLPPGLKPKHLESETWDVGPSVQSTQQIGTLEREIANFDIWSLGTNDDQAVGGEELKSLSCLLPRKKKGGKLFKAPKPFARHILLVAQPVKPSADGPSQTYQNPPRFAYPKDALTHQFVPYGANTLDPDAAGRGKGLDDADVDAVMEVDAPTATKAAKEPKGKKRKVEGENPTSSPVKKTKKAKTSA